MTKENKFMSFKRECSIITLPTREADENCLLVADVNGLMSKNIHKQYFTQTYLRDSLKITSHHLYVLLYDESKIGFFWEKGTWILDLFNNIRQAEDRTIISPNDRQIIATTDKAVNYVDDELSKSMRGEIRRRISVPTDTFIDEFIESFNSKKPITKVLVDFIKHRRCVKCKAPFLVYTCTCGEQDNFEYFEHLKISRDNTINIMGLKSKENLTREEAIELIKDAVAESLDWSKANDNIHSFAIIEGRFLNKWIEDKL